MTVPGKPPNYKIVEEVSRTATRMVSQITGYPFHLLVCRSRIEGENIYSEVKPKKGSGKTWYFSTYYNENTTTLGQTKEVTRLITPF